MLTYTMVNREKERIHYISETINISQVSDCGLKFTKYAYDLQCRLNDKQKKAVTNFTFSLSLCIKYDSSTVTVNLSKPFGQNTVWQL